MMQANSPEECKSACLPQITNSWQACYPPGVDGAHLKQAMGAPGCSSHQSEH